MRLLTTVLTLSLASSVAFAGINPASPGLPAGLTDVSLICVDCHTYNPKPNSGTHFVVHDTAGPTVRNTNNINIEHLGNWTDSGKPSKYGAVIAGSMPAATTTAARGEMICESCHSVRHNVAGGNNLLAGFGASGSDELCAGCHASQASGPPYHHPLTGDTVGADSENSAPHTLSTTHSSHVKAVPVPGDDVYYPAADQVSCASCHSPHGAAEGGGARVLRRGFSASTSFPGEELNLIYVNNVPMVGDSAGDTKIWDTGNYTPGIDRQSDIVLTYGNSFRLVSNADPLCDACHAR